MDDPLIPRAWAYRALLALIAALVMFLHLLPLHLETAGWPAPDIVLATAFAWVLRRPDYVPALLLVLLVLVSDLLFLRPPGLWAAIALGGVEFLRAREPLLRDAPFASEWFTVASVLVACMLAYRLVLAIFMVDQAGLGLTLMQLLVTIVIYPLVALISSQLLGVTKIAPGEIDRMGQRI